MTLKILKKKRSDLDKQDIFLATQKFKMNQFKNSQEKTIRFSQARAFCNITKVYDA